MKCSASKTDKAGRSLLCNRDAVYLYQVRRHYQWHSTVDMALACQEHADAIERTTRPEGRYVRYIGR